MKKKENRIAASRRDFMKTMTIGSAAGLLGFKDGLAGTAHYEPPSFAKAQAPVKIESVKAIGTKAGRGSNLVIVKVETTEPGLYGIGCATFTQRAFPVVTAIDSYLNSFCTGRDADNIEDMWQ